MNKFIVTIFGIMFISGCANTANQSRSGWAESPVDRQVRLYKEASAQYFSCARSVIENTKRKDLVDRYLIVNPSDPRMFEKLTSKDPVPDELKAELLGLQPARVACRTAFLTQMSGQDLRLVQTYIENFNTFDNVSLSLAKNEIKTVGELNEKTRSVGQEANARRQQVYNTLNSELRQANIEDQQRRAAAAQILLNNWNSTQQALQQQQNQYLNNLMKPPVTTNCYVIGNSIDCTTR